MDARPKVSVIMPVYNAQATLEEAIASVVRQSFLDWELICVDDHSSDNSPALLRKWGEKDRRIRPLFPPEHLGAAGARNLAIQAAMGEWIAFLDADDLWAENKLARWQEEAAKDPDCPFFFTSTLYIPSGGSPTGKILHAPAKVGYRNLLRQNVISCSSAVLRRELLLSHPMPGDNAVHEDYVTWLRILHTGITARGIDEPLLLYRLSPKSRSGNKLRAAGMQLASYRAVGIRFPAIILYFLSYAFRNTKKYAVLRLTSFRRTAK